MAKAATNVEFMPASAHDALAEALASTFPAARLIRDPLRRLAYGTDASFYRLVPKLVVVVEDEAEMAALLHQCRMFGTPLTFRAAGTSLSGQAVTDSVLAVLGDGWGGVAAPTRPPSTPARSAASPPTTPAACAAAPARTATVPWPRCG